MYITTYINLDLIIQSRVAQNLISCNEVYRATNKGKKPQSHLSYIDTLQQVNCDIMYIQQNTPQITIHLLYIDTLQ